LLEVLSRPTILAVECLVQHLEPEDPILLWHRDSGEELRNYHQLCDRMYQELIDSVNNLSREILLPLGFRWIVESAAITPDGFVDSLYRAAGCLVSGVSSDDELPYRRVPYGERESLQQLTAGRCIAIGSEAQLSRIETAHRELRSWWAGHELVRDIRESHHRFQELANKLDRAVAVRSQQRTFLPGPCEICGPWGGLR